jgi:hypothetical protein
LTTSLYIRLAVMRFREAPARFAVITLAWLIPFVAVSTILTQLPLWWLTCPLAFGPFWVGYLYYFVRYVEGDDPHWNALFFGWRRAFFASAMSSLVIYFLLSSFSWVVVSLANLTGLLRAFGWGNSLPIVVALLSTLFVWSAFFLAYPLIADGEKNFAAALQRSATIVWQRLPDYLGFTLVCSLFLLVAGITIVGLLVALPIVGLAVVQAHRYERDSFSTG